MTNTLYDALFGPHAGHEKPFLKIEEGREISYRHFVEMASGFAHVLTDNGIKPGDRVAVQVEKSPQSLALYAATLQAGGVFLPLNPTYTANEVAYFIENAEPAIFVCDPSRRDLVQPICEKAGAGLLTLDSKGGGTLAETAQSKPTAFDTVARSGGDLAAILYTSGTTGRSKGAMLSHDNLLSNAQVLVDYWRFGDEDVLMHALPIYHTHGLFVATNVILLAGGSMIFLPKFDLDAMIARFPEATTLMGVPTFYTRLLDDERFTRALVGHMRLFVSGSAPLLAETHHDFEARTGHRILERYGMTETNMNTSNPYDGERRAGTVGFALPGVSLRVADAETGAPVGQGEIGVIEVKGPNVFGGYWRMPEKTREEFRDDGFFITGDLGRIDEDGYVHIVGRAKDLIISGGFNIYPKEVELVLDEQDGVLESAVVGIPHADLGEGVVAAVVPRGGNTLDEAHLRQAIADKLARYKQPRRIVIVEALPRNAMGKVQKNVLREQYGDLFSGR